MVGRGEDLLDEVLVAGDGALGAHSPTGLLIVFGQTRPLDVAGMADRDDHLFVRNHVLNAEFRTGELDAGTALVAKLLAHLQQLILDDAHAEGLVLQNGLQASDEFHQLVVFGTELVALESRELLEAHVEDGPSLDLTELELLHQAIPRVFRRLASPDEGDDGIEVVDGDDEALQDVGPLLSLAQLVLCAADDHIVAVVDVMEDHLPQAKQLRAPFDQGDVVDRETGLELGVLVKLIQHHVGDGIALEVKHHPHAFPVGLVADFADALDLLFVDEVGRLADHVRLVDLVGNLLDDDLLLAGAGLFEAGLAAHDHPASASLIRILDSLHAIDDASRREVRGLDVLHQSLHRNVGVIDHGHTAVDDLGQVVGRHVGGHAHGNARCTIDEQVRNLGRKHSRLLEAVVEVVGQVDCLLVQVGQHLFGHFPKAGLRVTHGRGVVSVNGAEVSLTIHHGIAHGPILRKAHHRVVHGAVSMRVVLAQHLSDDTGGLLVGSVGQDAQLEHAVEHPAVHRLQSIPDIGQRPRHDDRHRVIDVGRLHLILDRNRNDFLSFCHVVIPP